ncbi:lonely Cys domain-containing protein [Streptomyces sp. SJ1-7]|nr:lonely Cys domain-containing protein [Streptomyces sp. SJ1-7]
MTAQLPDGTTWQLDADEFAELVAADLTRHPLPGRTPIVLAVPSAGDRYLELPRKLAERTGRTVWVHSGLARRNPDPAATNTLAVLHRDGLPDGTWLPVRPGLAPDPHDDAPAWHHRVLTQPIVSSRTGEQIGRSFHELFELVGERESYRDLDHMSFYVHWDAATNTYSDKRPMEDPGPADKAYRLAGHGLPGGLSLPLDDGSSRIVDRDEATGWLRRRKSLVSLPEDHWVDLVICHSGAPAQGSAQDVSQLEDALPAAFTTDPLGDDALSLGQHLANRLRRTTRLSYSSQGVVRFGDGPVRVLATDAQGRPWWWETSRPEPDDAELDRLAEQAGFRGGPSPRVRSELLRVVRALKLVMGPDVVVADDFPALVAGAAAVVNMWFADPDLQPTGPFWPQLLSRVIAAHPLAAGGVDGDVTRQVLAEAAKAWRDAGGALPVSGFVPLPQLRTAADWLTDPAAVDRAAVDALRLADPADAPAHRPRMFWARVRAEETLPGPGPAADALTVRALRLDPATQLDDALRAHARALLTRGFAAGRNMADPDVVGAYAVEAAGALTAPALITTVGAAIGSGRDWRGLATLLPRLDSFRVADTTVDAPWAGQDADGKDRPAPYAVRASVDLEDSGHVQVTLGTESYRLTAAEFAELLSADADLRGLQPSAPVLLLLDGLGGPSPAVAETVSRRLGRPVWWSTSPVELSAPDAAEGELPLLVPDFSTLGQPSATDWRLTAPATPDLGVPTVPATPAPGPGAPTPATNSDPAPHSDVAADSARDGDRTVDLARDDYPSPASARSGVLSADSSRDSDTATAPARNGDPSTGTSRSDAPATGSPRNPRSSVGDPMEGVEATSVPTAPALPAVPVAPASVQALQPLPPRTLVAYGRDEMSPSAQGDRTLELLAAQVAATGLRNRRAGAALPRVEVTGYGAEVGPDRASTGSPGRRRAFTARQRFTRLLESELQRLQRDLPTGETRLTAQDFPFAVRAMARVPADWVGTGVLAQVSRAELGRQAVIALRLPPDAVAVQRLDTLRRRDRALRTRPLDVDAIARRVLHLDPGAAVQQDDRQELFDLVGRATAAGRATGFAALAAYHLSELGVTAPGRAHHFTVGGSRVPGLNWGTSDVIALDTTRSDLLEADPAGGYDVLSTSPTPWPSTTTPYVVAAEGGRDRVEARLPDGTVRELGVEVFVELVAEDVAREALPPDTPIVLAVPFTADGYLDLPRRLADRTGRTVWAHSGRVTVESAPGESSTIDVVRTPKTPRGDWIASDPGLGPDPDDDVPDWHHDVVTRALVSALSGRQIGRASHHPAEFARDFEDDDRHLDRMGTFVHDHPATDRVSGEYEMPRPGPEDRAYRLDMHGSPGGLTLALRDGTTRDIDEREAGPWLRRRKSLTTLPKDHWVDLVVCWSGAPGDSAVPRPSMASDAYGGPFVADPLATVSMGQHVANATGRAVRLAYGPQGTRESNGRYQRTLFADAQGRRRAWALARPEPDEDELDRLAEVAGVSPGDGEVSDEMRTATLRLVRALRFTLGHDIDDDPGFDELLRGAAAVDQMWRSDSDFQEAGPFTLDLLHRVVAAHPEAAAGVDGPTTRRVLAAAAEHWSRYPGEGVAGFVDLPAVEAAAQWLAQEDAEAEAAAVLRLSDDEVGEAELSRMFWARVKAEETLPGTGPDAQEFAARVLHRDPGPSAAHARRAEALDVLTRAFAVGREASVPDTAAAYALKEAGAYEDTAFDTVQGASDGTGRDFTGGGATGVDLTRFRTPAGLVDTPWAQGANGEDRPVPYLVWAGADADDSDLVEVSWGGDTYAATAGEFAELLAADPALLRAELTVPVVLALPGPAADAAALADRVARRLGRTVWWTGFPVDLSGTGDPVLTLRPTADGTDPGATAWQRTRPAHPSSAEDAPRPVPAPLSRSARGDGAPEPAGQERTSAPAQHQRSVPRASGTTAQRAPSASTAAAPTSAQPSTAPPGRPGGDTSGAPVRYSADGRFDGRFADTTAEFPLLIDDGWQRVWGFGQDDAEFHVFVAEIASLGLRGEYNPDGPTAGRVTDMNGRLYDSGPSWDWYLPGRGLVASSRLRAVTGRVEGQEELMEIPANWPATGPVSPTPPVDPASVAADPAVLAGGKLPEALWRDHDGPLYRFSPDGPDRVFAEGLKPYGPEMVHLIDHVYNSNLTPRTLFSSTTANQHYVRDSARANPAGAPALFRRYRWRYDIVAPGGIDVNATLGPASPFPDQEEVLFPGGVAGRHIRGVQPILDGNPVGPSSPTRASRRRPAPKPLPRRTAGRPRTGGPGTAHDAAGPAERPAPSPGRLSPRPPHA